MGTEVDISISTDVVIYAALCLLTDAAMCEILHTQYSRCCPSYIYIYYTYVLVEYRNGACIRYSDGDYEEQRPV